MRLTETIGVEISGEYIAALSIESLRLLLPHHQIRTLEPVSDIEKSQKPNAEIGWIVTEGAKIPVYCLSRDLAILDMIPHERRIAALLAADAGAIGILCDDLKIIAGKECTAHPLPDCMEVSGTPITGLVIHNDAVCCLSSTDQLLTYLIDKSQLPGSRIYL